MLVTITVVSILAVTALVWLANRVLPVTVCPICAGIFLTWVWLLGARFLGYEIDLTVPALLIGGSVVGIAYQLEKKFRGVPPSALLLWKILFIPGGFIAAYSVLEQLWTAAVFAAAFLLLAWLVFLYSSRGTKSREETVGGIEKKMEDCC